MQSASRRATIHTSHSGGKKKESADDVTINLLERSLFAHATSKGFASLARRTNHRYARVSQMLINFLVVGPAPSIPIGFRLRVSRL